MNKHQLSKKECPFCKNRMQRIRRKRWMRLIPKAKAYRCSQCRRQYFAVFFWLIPLKRKHRS